MAQSTCSVDGCEKQAKARGFCGTHHRRWCQYGDPLGKKYQTPRPCETCGLWWVPQKSHVPSFCSSECRDWWGAKTVYGRKTPIPRVGLCAVDGCDKPVKAIGLCAMHSSRHYQNGGDLRGPSSERAPNGAGCINRNGYRVLQINNRRVLEHRYVMEQAIGRKLYRHENVHHINGDRADNRLENLELWSKAQPSGQRIPDKVAWAKELLSLYEPAALVAPVALEQLTLL